MLRETGHRIIASILVVASLAALATAAQAATSTLVIRSGALPDQDANVWVQGSADVRAGLPSSGIALQHPYIVNTPTYWGEVVGGVFWLSPAPNTSAPPGGYEYFTQFTLPDDVAAARVNVLWRGDDWTALAMNGQRLSGIGFSPPTIFPATVESDVTLLVQTGVNRMSFIVENAFSAPNPTGIAFRAHITYTRKTGSGMSVITLKSGSVERDPLVWIRGSAEVQPGVPSAGLALQHPFIVNTPPGLLGDLGGGSHWVCPMPDTSGKDGGYEYFVDFDLPATLKTATLDLRWRGRNYAIPAVNGSRLPGFGPELPKDPPSTLHTSITPIVRPGANRLSFFIEQRNPGFSPTGVIFEAIVTYTD